MKRFIEILALILTFIMLFANSIIAYAHPSMLNVDYEVCGVPRDQHGQIIPQMDGEDELWYWLIDGYSEFHISHTVKTIKYYFASDAKGSDTYTWTTDLTEIEALEIKEAYANSMKKWNDIYYYSYDENGNRIANKIINVVEGTYLDHNLVIYPTHNQTFSAQTFYSDVNRPIIEMNNKQIAHFHCDNWWMEVNIDSFKEGYPDYYVCREKTGEHELGHVLGIFDVDKHCTWSSEIEHHEELLMGYGTNLSKRYTYAKYKDIAGVSITRGFHTDSDHVWMLRTNTNGTHDVICAQCNGVRYNVTLSIDANNNITYEGKQLNIYKSCVHYGGSNENMLLVATDGTRDFYKCQYCRHIEEVNHTHSYVSIGDEQHKYSCSCAIIDSSIINHTLQYSNITSTHHTYGCTECGYSVTSEHDMYTSPSISPTEHGRKCRDCGYVDESTVGTHSYNSFMYVSDTAHRSTCDVCGVWKETTSPHTFTILDRFGKMACIGCGYTKYFGSDSGNIILSITKVSANGSYILPDGTIVLVEEDIEAYLNGTLVFYDKDNVPQVQ